MIFRQIIIVISGLIWVLLGTLSILSRLLNSPGLTTWLQKVPYLPSSLIILIGLANIFIAWEMIIIRVEAGYRIGIRKLREDINLNNDDISTTQR